MDNLQKYNNALCEAFGISEDKLPGLKYQDIQEWDSVGHMSMIAILEEMFDIMMEMEDIIDFSSYETGKELLLKYDIVI